MKNPAQGIVPLFVLGALGLTVGLLPHNAPVAPVSSTPAGPSAQARQDQLNDIYYAARMSGQGANQTRADLRQAGFEDVTTATGPATELVSSSSDVTVPKPTFTIDRTSGNLYLTGSYNWTNTKWSGDKSCGSTCNVGATDAFALGWSRALTQTYTSSRFSGSDNATPVRKPQPSDNGSQGIGYEFQDQIYVYFRDPGTGVQVIKDYLGKVGIITVGVKQIACGSSVQAWGKYAHTWSSASITGIAFGSGIPQISINNSAHSFSKATSVGSVYKRTC